MEEAENFEPIQPGVYRLSNDGKRKIVEAMYNRFNEQAFWDGKRREPVIRHQMQCLAQYFLGKRSGYEPFRVDAVKKSLGRPVITNPPVCMLITWHSRNRRRLEKAVGLCKDYGLTALSRRVYLGNVKKNDLPELQQQLRRLLCAKNASADCRRTTGRR
jgi:hypothetical protein